MSEDQGAAAPRSNNKERSPNYPALAITQAIELVSKLYEREKRTTVQPDAAVKALGYGAMSGTARTAIAALRQYGLVDSARDGLRVSDLAMDILHNPIGSAERTKALQEAALRPPLISELMPTHADASEDSLRAYLITRRKFSPEGAGRFVLAFKESVQIVRLPGGGSTEPKQGDGRDFKYPPPPGEQIGGTIKIRPPAKDAGENMEFVWQLSGDVIATMTVSKKIEVDDVETLIANLEAAKRAIMKQAKVNEFNALAAKEAVSNASQA